MPFVEDDQQEIAERVSIAEAFRKFGTDASGKLGRQEFEKAMVLGGSQTDTDGSGVVDLQEFAALVKGIHAGGSQEQQRQHPLTGNSQKKSP
jgi:Ca2+-binding EF-hand superfamily protein